MDDSKEKSGLFKGASKSATKPLLLLDVDGVLCPFGSELNSPPKGYAPAVISGGNRWLWCSDLNRDYLAELAGYYDLTWATMWENDANSTVGEWHFLDPMPHISFTEYYHRNGGFPLGEHHKIGAVQEYVGDRPFAWVDDDIDDDVIAWAGRREQPTLALPIRPEVGLDAEAVERLRTFARSIIGGMSGI